MQGRCTNNPFGHWTHTNINIGRKKKAVQTKQQNYTRVTMHSAALTQLSPRTKVEQHEGSLRNTTTTPHSQ